MNLLMAVLHCAKKLKGNDSVLPMEYEKWLKFLLNLVDLTDWDAPQCVQALCDQKHEMSKMFFKTITERVSFFGNY